jgi:hypothetical protein
MTAIGSFDDSNPSRQLSLSRDLARLVRRRQRASWFPLLVFAVVTFVAIPVTRGGHAAGINCQRIATTGAPVARLCVAHNSAAYIYWPIALIVAYVLIAAFYVRLSRARGVGTRVRPYVITGAVLAVAATAASIWAGHTVLVGEYDVLGWHLQGQDLYRLAAPACAIGLALVVLAALDRSPALAVFTVAYLVIAIGGITFGWTISGRSAWSFAPHLIIDGALLMLGAAGFAMVQLPRSRNISPA